MLPSEVLRLEWRDYLLNLAVAMRAVEAESEQMEKAKRKSSGRDLAFSYHQKQPGT